MSNRKVLLNKTLLITVIILLVSVAITPFSGVISKEIESQETIDNQDEKAVTCYVFDKKDNSKQEVVLSSDDFERFYSMFEELNHKVIYSPFGRETEVLKLEFVDLVNSLGLIPDGSSKEDIIRLLDPSFGHRRPLFSFISNPVTNPRGFAFFCNFATWGEGSQFPVIILPRLIPILLIPIPRVIMRWNANYGITSCGGLLSGKGFIAEGAQKGTALGFWGIGFSVFLPPVMSFGFIGYALFATASAENIIPWPPNRPPGVSGETPSDGSVDVPLSLSELSFNLADLDGDRMNYTVTTSPYIGGDSGNNVKDGDFSFDIFGLESDTDYSWTVRVSDGEDTTEETYTFLTEVEAPFVTDPLPFDGDDWVSVDISELSFRLEDFQSDPMDFTVETVPDIGSGSGSGVGNGIYSVPVSGLDYTTDYTWFVNVTDGKVWIRKVFRFKTQPIMVFNPFDEGWSYRKMITINHSQVAGDLVDFPVLISLTDVDLRDKAKVDGDDILFMNGSGVAGRLFHEIETYDGSSGELVCWVNVSNLSSTEDSILFLYYGNSGCSSQEYCGRVWDSDFIHVWHLGDSLIDSAGPNDGVDHGTSIVSGKVGNARDLECDEKDFIDFSDMSQPGDGCLTTMTWEAWVKPKSFNDECCIMNKYNTQGSDLTSYYIAINVEGKFRSSVYQSPGSKTRSITTDAYAEIGHWIYVTSTFNLGGTNDIVPFIDGDEVSDTQPDSNSDYMRDISVSDDIGRFKAEAGTRYIDAVIDEVKWSKVVRSDDWIKTSFNTMNDPSIFFSVGSEESGP